MKKQGALEDPPGQGALSPLRIMIELLPQEPKGPLTGEGGGQRCPSLDRGILAVLEVSLE